MYYSICVIVGVFIGWGFGWSRSQKFYKGWLDEKEENIEQLRKLLRRTIDLENGMNDLREQSSNLDEVIKQHRRDSGLKPLISIVEDS